MQHIANQILPHFSNLHFEEERHIYTVDGSRLPSVSGLIKDYHKPFPKDAATNVAKRDGLTETQVRTNWKEISDEACDRGHRVHTFGEHYPFDRNLKPPAKPGTLEYEQQVAVMKFWDEMPPHLSPVIMELRMYHKVFRYAGTADIILFNNLTGKLLIADYKTNKDLYKNFMGQTLINGFEHLLDCPLNKYQLQLSFYQIMLEQTGFEIEDRVLVWLKNDANYEMYKLENLTEQLKFKLAA